MYNKYVGIYLFLALSAAGDQCPLTSLATNALHIPGPWSYPHWQHDVRWPLNSVKRAKFCESIHSVLGTLQQQYT